MTLSLVETIEVGTGAPAQLSFSNIPQTGKHLLIKFAARDEAVATIWSADLNLNGDTTAAYQYLRIYGFNSSTPITNIYTARNYLRMPTVGSSWGAGSFSAHDITIYDYQNSQDKIVSFESTLADYEQAASTYAIQGRYSTSSPITSLDLSSYTATGFSQFTIASLYTIG